MPIKMRGELESVASARNNGAIFKKSKAPEPHHPPLFHWSPGNEQLGHPPFQTYLAWLMQCAPAAAPVSLSIVFAHCRSCLDYGRQRGDHLRPCDNVDSVANLHLLLRMAG